MHKKILFICFIALVFSTIQAQNLHYGLSTGIDASNFHRTNLKSSTLIDKFSKTNIAYNINAIVSYKVDSLWGFTFEPGYIQKGWSEKYGETKIVMKLNYIQVPMTADFYFKDKFSISIGPELAYMIMDNSGFRNFELSALAGVNYALSEKIKIALRYNHGLTFFNQENFTDANGTILYTSKMYNQYFQLNVRYLIK